MMINGDHDTDDVQHATSVLLVDDHRMFTELLGLALEVSSEFECVGTAQTGAEALDLAIRHQPDLVLMDIQLRGENGLDATAKIRDVLPEAVIVVVSAHQDPLWVARAAQAGASAFTPKSGTLPEMLDVLRRAHKGHMLVSPSIYRRAAAKMEHAPRVIVDRLTAREHEVLVLMGKGMVPAAIAPLLGITLNTCRHYVKSIHLKLGVRSQLEAVVTAQRLGIIDAHEQP
jgi:DNA-binding NarL/FixJ family response regulator